MNQRPDLIALIGANYDSEGELARRKLIICSAPRTGSYELCRFLTAAGIGTPHEYFNPNYATRLAQRWGISGDPLGQDNIQAYIESLLARRVRNGIFAAKLQYGQYRAFLENPRGLRFLCDATFVHLYRPDVLRQFQSLRVSSVSGRWDYSERTSTPPQPDSVEGALSSLRVLLQSDAGLRGLFFLVGKTPLLITTKDIIEEPKQTVDRIARLVGVDADLEAVEELVAASEPYKRDIPVEKKVEATIKTLRARLLDGQAHGSKIDLIDHEVARLGTTTDSLKQELSKVRQDLSKARRSLRCLRRERSALAASIAAIRNSTSWRITSPLRRIRLFQQYWSARAESLINRSGPQA